MKKYDPVSVIGSVICIIAFVAIMFYMPKGKRQQEIQYQQPQNNPIVVTETGNDAVSGVDSQDSQSSALPSQPAVITYDPLSVSPAASDKDSLTFNGANAEAIYTFSQHFGGITRVELLKHKLTKPRHGDENQNPPNVILGRQDYPFLSLDTLAANMSLKSGEVQASADGKTYILVRNSTDDKFCFTETWQFPGTPDDYSVEYTVSVKNLSGELRQISELRVEVGSLPPSIGGVKGRMGESYGGITCGLLGKNDSENLNMRDVTKKMDSKKKAELAVTNSTWLALHSKYFLFCIKAGWESGFQGLEANGVPIPSMSGINIAPQEPANKYYHARAILPAVQLNPDQETTFTIHGYAGPKDFKRLHDMGGNVETVMEMDRFFWGRFAWMGWLSRILLAGLDTISKWFPPSIAYGMGIIFLTLIIKLIFWPLSHRSQVSMKKMQALQPQLKELREKYKNDPQRMYAKQQELFKANNVSQMGGCLPMLLQIPVFYALYSTFRNAVELRLAGFLWIYDLSMPDDLPFTLFGLAIRPCALLMGGTMFLQQKMTPSADPNQAKMMSFMSIIFIFMFYQLPSALTLYMTVNQLFTIVQMLITKRLDKNKPAVTVVLPGANQAR